MLITVTQKNKRTYLAWKYFCTLPNHRDRLSVVSGDELLQPIYFSVQQNEWIKKVNAILYRFYNRKNISPVSIKKSVNIFVSILER